MNLPEINTSLFKRLRFILVQTSRAGNIGAVARAMKTMGFHELVLVSPRFDGALQDPEAVAFASGAGDILAGARIVGTMAEALQGINYAAAVSARLREFSPPVTTPRDVASQLAAHGELHAALIFGNERFGLPNDIVEKCNVLINIPANPDYSSLNLSQAAQVLAYECRMAALALDCAAPTAPGAAGVGGGGGAGATHGTACADIGFHGVAANVEQIEGMYTHLEQSLVEIGFLDAGNPRKLMPRLKRMFARAQLEQEEVNILRGIARQMVAGRKAGQ
ncbi:RNA methyltransferase [Rugamonas sp.]|uniref:RNA methyltransferase n=1 Tax=Rugamonas sp. TaxID=1926287 RepID=UPI0025F73FD0|nr:RNA methyltransferase [Rugamonas sp.]